MLFNTAAFGVLLMLVVTLAWALRAAGLPWPVERRARIGLLLVASYWFYACWDRRFVLLIGGVTLVDWLAALALERLRDARSRLWLLAATVGLNLGLLGLWKYTDFFGDSFAAAMALLGSPSHFEPLGLLLPVGISFFIFQGLSYVIDVYRRDITAERSLPRFALFISFFPQLVAGPIVRAKQLLPQLDRPLVLDTPRFGRALALILGGLLKKVVVADYLAANLVDRVFDLPTHYGSIEVLCGVYGYALQIYGDFSGYCDIAIGVALLLGIELPLNFDLPYRADGLRDFWRRWHITLSRWLRDYLYISMGGSRGSRHATYRNLAITMLLGGLWHGASYNFVIWGGLHGAALVAGRMWSQRRAQRAGARAAPLPSEPVATVLPRWARVALTFHVVCALWIFFRADTLTTAVAVLTQLVSFVPGTSNLSWQVLTVIVGGYAMHFAPRGWHERLWASFIRAPAVAQAAATILVLYAVQHVADSAAAPFIYFQF